MKKVLFSLFFICLFLFPCLADYTVDQATVNAEVAQNGKTKVTATYQLTFDSQQDQVQIPLPDGDISRVSAETYRYKVDKTDAGVDVVLSKGTFSGTQSFTISYTVNVSPDSSTDGDVFTLGLLSSRWATPVGACAFQVTLPQPSGTVPADYTITPQVLSGYYGPLSDTETGLTVNGTIVTGTAADRMAYDSLALAVTLPSGYFYVRSTAIPMIHVTYLFVGMLLVLLLLMVYWRLRLRTPRLEVSPRLLTPGGLLACQLSQMLDGGTCDVAVLVLEWANLGYLTIQSSKKGYVILTRMIPMGNERSKAEQRLFTRIFATGNRVAATPGRFSAAAARFRAASRRSLNRVIFDRKGGNVVFLQIPCRILLAIGTGYIAYSLLPDGSAFLFLAVLIGIVGFLYSIYLHDALAKWVSLRRFSPRTLGLLLVALLILILGLMSGAFLEAATGLFACCFSAIATASGPRRSQRGRDLLMQTRGLKLFYRKVSWQQLQVITGRNDRFFQAQYPKAAALGVDKAFAARFERLPTPRPEWLPGGSGKTTSAAALQRRLADILKSLRAAF